MSYTSNNMNVNGDIDSCDYSKDNDIIFSASYSKLKSFISLILIVPLFTYLLSGVLYTNIVQKKYISAIFVLIMLLPILLIALDTIMFKSIVFYRDRVQKNWYFGGRRTIYYSYAKIVGPPGYFRWLSSAYQIRETYKNGKTILFQMPILYMSFFFPLRIEKTITQIIEYLTEDKVNNPRFFVKNSINIGDIQCHS